MPIFAIGQEVKFLASFYNAQHEPADPTTVRVHFLSPQKDKELYTYGVDVEITRVADGVYQILKTLTISGIWRVRWEGIGAVQAATRDTGVVVEATVFT